MTTGRLFTTVAIGERHGLHSFCHSQEILSRLCLAFPCRTSMASAVFIQRSASISSNCDSKPQIECAGTDRNNKRRYLEKFIWNLSHAPAWTGRVLEALQFDWTFCMTIRHPIYLHGDNHTQSSRSACEHVSMTRNPLWHSRCK